MLSRLVENCMLSTSIHFYNIMSSVLIHIQYIEKLNNVWHTSDFNRHFAFYISVYTTYIKLRHVFIMFY